LKEHLKEYLVKFGLPFPPGAVNKDVYFDLVRAHLKTNEERVLSRLAIEAGHRVLFLPPYSPTFNAIEEVR
jgi:transposase